MAKSQHPGWGVGGSVSRNFKGVIETPRIKKGPEASFKDIGPINSLYYQKYMMNKAFYL